MVEETVQRSKKAASTWVSRSKPVPITEVKNSAEAKFSTGSEELDRVLGGGLVPGCLGLIGGDPGIGKSTLLLQVASAVAKERGKVLYVTGDGVPQPAQTAGRTSWRGAGAAGRGQ